jgi:hypothetical protein
VRILFIVKKRGEYAHEYGYGYSYCDALGGLYNSARFVVQMLVKNGIVAELVQVVDNNDIDREVAAFKPDIVIIEAIWVVPSKFAILQKLHPTVKWVVRVHSEIPFLASEGVAIQWISEYVTYTRVSVATNSPRCTEDLRAMLLAKFGDLVADTKVQYLPNWYPLVTVAKPTPDPTLLNISCFGAIRPLKNQLIQALAAIEYADNLGKVMHFHINGTRCEQHGENVLRNLRALFAGTAHVLVEYGWQGHDEFLLTMARMDAAMAVSFTETFNITAADAATANVPLVTSSEVTWASPLCFAIPNSAPSIVATLNKVTSSSHKARLIQSNRINLTNYDNNSQKTWLAYIEANG